MSDPVDMIVGIVALNGGKLVGRTRLQKTVYLLDACGMDSGLDYEYHNFGPFSVDVAEAADDACLLGTLRAEEYPGYHEVPYTVYTASASPPAAVGGMIANEAKVKLAAMGDYTAIELELAATYHYLKVNGYPANTSAEVARRKPTKATPDRMKRAKRLLTDLGLM